MPSDLCEVAETTRPTTPATVPLRPSVLHHYEAIARASSEMLAAARADEWLEVAKHEERCGELITALKMAEHYPGAPLNAVDDERRMQLLRQILTDDAEIRGLAEPWLESITPYLSSARTR